MVQNTFFNTLEPLWKSALHPTRISPTSENDSYCYFMDLSSPFINQRLTKLCPPKLFGLWNLKLFITNQIITNQVAALVGYFLQHNVQLLQNWNVSWYELHYAALAQQIAARCKEGKFLHQLRFWQLWTRTLRVRVARKCYCSTLATCPQHKKEESKSPSLIEEARCCLISPTDCLRGSCQPAGCSWRGVGALLSLCCFLTVFCIFLQLFFKFNKKCKK